MEKNYFAELIKTCFFYIDFNSNGTWYIEPTYIQDLSDKFGLSEQAINDLAKELSVIWLNGYNSGYSA